MKNLIILFFLFLTLSSCKDETIVNNENVLAFETETNLKAGTFYENTDLSIRLDSVTTDSRCPSDVYCIWEGNASVKFIVTIEDIKHTISLNTNLGNSFPSDTTLQQYFIEFKNLIPYPVSTSIISQADYQATIVVKKLED